MKNKIALIIDSSEAYLRTKTEELFKEWGFVRSNVTEMDEWVQIQSSPSLFGELMMTHLVLTDKKDLKAFADLISSRQMKPIFDNENWYGNGIIITATTPVGTKKIEKLIQQHNGQIFKKETSKKRKDQLFKELKLNSDVQQAVDSFVGEDYELMLSFYNEVEKMSIEDRKKMTLERAFSLFPPIPGSVPPWEYLNKLLQGSTSEAISLFRRTIINTHFLVALVFLSKKTSLLLRVAFAMEDGYNTNDRIAKETGDKNGPELWSITNLARHTPNKNIIKINQIVAKLESDLKGGSAVIPEILFEEAIAKIGLLLGNRK